VYIAPLSVLEAFPTQVSSITGKQDNLQTFPKKGRERMSNSRTQLRLYFMRTFGVLRNEFSVIRFNVDIIVLAIGDSSWV